MRVIGKNGAGLPEPMWYVTRMQFKVELGGVACPPGTFGRLRRWLALKLWPQLLEDQTVEGVMQYMPVRGTD